MLNFDYELDWRKYWRALFTHLVLLSISPLNSDTKALRTMDKILVIGINIKISIY